MIVLLTLLFLSPLVWLPLLTRTETVKLGAILALGALWQRRVAEGRGSSIGALPLIFLVTLVWMDGTLLWLASPRAAWWQSLPLVLLGVAALAGLRESSVRGRAPAGQLRTNDEPLATGHAQRATGNSPLALLWAGVGAATLVRVGGESRLMPEGLLAALPVLLATWSFSRARACGSAGVRAWPDEGSHPRTLALTLVVLFLGGLAQDVWFTRHFAALARDPEPWATERTADALDRLAAWESRFPQRGGAGVLQALRGLQAQRHGEAATALRALAEALDAAPSQPAVVSAACHVWGRLAALGPLAQRISPAQVNAARSPEAARHLLGALIAADDFGRARALHAAFGDALFTPGHPVLTPVRIGAALVAWDRCEEALVWFSSHRPQPEEVAESLFWRGLALARLSRESEARSVWQLAVGLAPDHADARAHLRGGVAGVRAGSALLPVPIAGRQLVEVSVEPVSPETLAQPLSLAPGQIIRVQCAWRLTSLSEQPLEVRLQLGALRLPLTELAPTAALLQGARPLHLGEQVVTEGTVRLPASLPPDAGRAALVISTPEDAPLPETARLDLAPLAVESGFRRLDPRDTRSGISAANRLRLFPRGSEALGLAATLQGTDSALAVLDPPRRARRLAVLSYLSGGRLLLQGQVVAQLFVSDQRGTVLAFPLLAGRDTADIWREYPPFQPEFRHGLAPIAWQTPRSHRGFDFHNNIYLATLDLGREMEIRALRLRTALPERTSLGIVDLVAIPE